MKTKIMKYCMVISLVLIFGFVLIPAESVYAAGGGGTGTLTASGNGLAGIKGDGEVTISGNGVLWIFDHNGDANIQVTGHGLRQDLPSGWIMYSGFDGEAQVSGSLITVALSGFDINLEASGTGRFLLRGTGTYQTGDKSGEWTMDGVVISVP